MADLNVLNQWLDWGDVTRTVDPVGTKQWIHDGRDGHERSERRGLEFDAREVRKLLGWEQKQQPPLPEFYQPSVAAINARGELFSTPMGAGCKSWRGVTRDPKRFGVLPVHELLKRDGWLINKDTDAIAREIQEYERRRGARLFDTGDWQGASRAPEYF